MRWRGFCLSCLIFVSVSGFALQADLCETLLASRMGNQDLSATQAQRLWLLLYKKLDASQRRTLFGLLNHENLSALAGAIRYNRLSSADRSLLASPVLKILVQDLAEFGNGWPGAFEGDNADQKVRRALFTILKEERELNEADKGRTDLLKAQLAAPRLRLNIENTIYNLFAQIESERANRSLLRRLSNSVHELVSPTQDKVKTIVRFAEKLERELVRLQMVDRLFVEALENQDLTDQESSTLVRQVLAAPQEVQLIENEMVRVFGSGFSRSKAVPAGQFDIRQIARLASETVHLERTQESFREENLKALAILNQVVNGARARQGLPPRSLQDLKLPELQIQFESWNERLGYFKNLYDELVSEPAAENYRIVEARTLIVGQGSNGTPIRRTEEGQRVVKPTMDDLLNGKFELGNGDNSAVNSLKERTASLRESEGPARTLVNDAMKMIDDGMSGHTQWDDQQRSDFLAGAAKLITKIQSQIPIQKNYLRQGPPDGGTYDTAENFRKRNEFALDMLLNSENALTNLSELLRRGEPDLHPSYTLADISGDLRLLEAGNRRARFDQAALASLTAATAASVIFFPEIRQVMHALPASSADSLIQFLASVRTAFPM